MESMTTLQLAAILFGLGALGGLTMAAMRLSGKPRPPTWMAMGHGVAGAAGLTLLAYAAFTMGVPRMAQLALVVLLVAAAGGATIFLRFHQKGLALPIPFVVGHGLLAATGLVLLLLTIF